MYQPLLLQLVDARSSVMSSAMVKLLQDKNAASGLLLLPPFLIIRCSNLSQNDMYLDAF
jgi:hypothetical protein